MDKDKTAFDSTKMQEILDNSKKGRQRAQELIVGKNKSSTGRDSRVGGPLFDPGIDGATVVHISGKSKQIGILNGYERQALWSLGQAIMRRGGLTKKQIKFLNDLLSKAKRMGLDRAGCSKRECKRCQEFSDYVINKDPPQIQPGQRPRRRIPNRPK